MQYPKASACTDSPTPTKLSLTCEAKITLGNYLSNVFFKNMSPSNTIYKISFMRSMQIHEIVMSNLDSFW